MRMLKLGRLRVTVLEDFKRGSDTEINLVVLVEKFLKMVLVWNFSKLENQNSTSACGRLFMQMQIVQIQGKLKAKTIYKYKTAYSLLI